MSQSTRNAYKPKLPFKTIEGLGTQPWMRLSRNSVYVLDRLYAQFNGYNRDDLSLTYGKMKDKMSGRLFLAALWELMALGFVDRVRAGRLERECSIFRLSNRWRKLEHEPRILDEIGALLRELQEKRRERGSEEKRRRMRELGHRIMRLSGAKRA